VETSIVAFRYAPLGTPDAVVDALNERLPAAIQARGRVFVTGSALAGRPILRACLINPATTEADLRVLFEEVRAAGAELLAD
jgi:glutamate/tyrosine decarboxylase-like PLP-dependent enzyme